MKRICCLQGCPEAKVLLLEAISTCNHKSWNKLQILKLANRQNGEDSTHSSLPGFLSCSLSVVLDGWTQACKFSYPHYFSSLHVHLSVVLSFTYIYSVLFLLNFIRPLSQSIPPLLQALFHLLPTLIMMSVTCIVHSDSYHTSSVNLSFITAEKKGLEPIPDVIQPHSSYISCITITCFSAPPDFLMSCSSFGTQSYAFSCSTKRQWNLIYCHRYSFADSNQTNIKE